MDSAKLHYDKFKKKPGATEIATPEALRLISKFIKESEFDAILEIGSGIGTISSYIVEELFYLKKYICYEKNEWCQAQFVKNVSKGNIKKFNSISQVILEFKNFPLNFTSLILLDDWIDLSDTSQLIEVVNPKIIFVEGHRRRQQLFIAKTLGRLNLTFTYKQYSKSVDSYKAGVSFTISKNKKNILSKFIHFKFILLIIYLKLTYSKIKEIRSKIPFRKIFSF